MNSRVFIKLCAAVMITAVAIILGLQFVKSKPKAKREKPASITPAVTVQPLAVKNHQAIVEVMGTVIPAKKVTVRSRVTGEIVTLHPDFLEGGFLQKGETIARLDDVDYKLLNKFIVYIIKPSNGLTFLQKAAFKKIRVKCNYFTGDP
jgi:multidrug efflux pump subunit AcrA (membrane-fusion protein)